MTPAGGTGELMPDCSDWYGVTDADYERLLNDTENAVKEITVKREVEE